MTREEAIQALDRLMEQYTEACEDHDGVTLEALNTYIRIRTYILDSIPTPKVEVVETLNVHPITRLRVNEFCVEEYNARTGSRTWIDNVYHDLRAWLGIGVKP